MDQARFDRARALRESGRVEHALEEFHSMAVESDDANEEAALMINEVRCYSMLGRVSDADHVLENIQELAPDDIIVRANVDFSAACVAAQKGEHGKALLRFEGMLEDYVDLLKTPEYRDLCEEIQQRRAFSLTHLGRYGEALPLLKEASSFSTLRADVQQQVHLYLGICYAALHEDRLAKEAFLSAIEFDLKNKIEAEARYRVGVLYFLTGGFAQAKHQLEVILQTYRDEVPNVPRKYVYQQLSRACHYLGEKENEKRYAKLAENSSL